MLICLSKINDTDSGRIKTLFSLLRQEKKEIREAAQSWNTRNLTDSSRYAQYCSVQPVNPAKFQPPDTPSTCRFFRRLNNLYSADS
jgi:hypothetical protein